MDDLKKKVIKALRLSVNRYGSLCGEKANYPTEFRDRNGYQDLAVEENLISTLASILGYDSEKAASYCFAVMWFAECYDCACEDDQIIANKTENEKSFQLFLKQLEQEASEQPRFQAAVDVHFSSADSNTAVSK